jgi:hypothetical protein
MALAQIGPLTEIAESLATAVGSGMLLGAFGVGAVGVVAGWPREVLEGDAPIAGYIGGIGAIVVIAIDLLLGYIY